MVFVTDGRYGEQAARPARRGRRRRGHRDRAVDGRAARRARRAAPRASPGSGSKPTASPGLSSALCDAEWFPDAELVPTEGLVDRERQVKDEGEVARIEAAAAIADEALRRDRCRCSATDRPSRRSRSSSTPRSGGAAPTATRSRRSSGRVPTARSLTPGRASRVVERGDLGRDRLRREGRRLLLRHDPHVLGRRAVTHTARACSRSSAPRSAAGVATVAAGVGVRDGRRGVRGVIDRGRVGRRVHASAPATRSGSRSTSTRGWRRRSTTRSWSGNVVTVEPGVYLPEHGGVRIEDTVLVTSDGCQPLTHAPKLTVI